MRPLLTLLAIAFFAAASVSSNPAAAQAPTPAFEAQGMVPGAASVKFPHLAATASTLHLAANINRSDATYWSKQDVDTSYGAALALGPAEDQPDYSTTSIATGPDGSLYYVWVNQPTRTISLRIKRPGQEWSAPSLVGSGTFPAFPEVAVASDGAIFVAWRNPDRPFVYRRSTNGGASWGPTLSLSDSAGVNIADFAAGPAGKLAVTYMGGESDQLQIYVATWNGSGFTKRRISSLNASYADPSATYTPDGRLVVAWRGVADSGYTAGVFFAEQQADGSFPVARLIGGKVAGRVSMDSDTAGNLHVLWTAAGGGGFQLWYTVQRAGGAWSSPVAAEAGAGLIFNATAAISTGANGQVYANAVSEVFYGSQVYLRHYRFRSSLTNAAVVSARPVLEGGEPMSRATSLGLSFADVTGTPTEVRYHWNSAPTDADAWRPYAAEMSLAGPTLSAASAASCNVQTLYTQVRSAGGLQTKALSDTITLDHAVQADVRHYNEYAAPGYTNRPIMGVLVNAPNDCSGLATVRPVISGVAPSDVPSTPYLLAINLTDEPGRYERGVELTDNLGNSGTYTVGVTYDPTAPTATYSEPVQIATNPNATIEQTIVFPQVVYQDDEGPDVLPWAVLVGVSRSSIDLESPSGVVWKLVPLDGRVGWSRDQQSESTLAAEVRVNLAEFVARAQLTPGSYYFALALTDNAGNPSSAKLMGTVYLQQVTFYRNNLPLLRK